jgi:hypothetical protein
MGRRKQAKVLEVETAVDIRSIVGFYMHRWTLRVA